MSPRRAHRLPDRDDLGGLTGVLGAEGRPDDLRTPLRLVSGLPDVFPDTVDEG